MKLFFRCAIVLLLASCAKLERGNSPNEDGASNGEPSSPVSTVDTSPPMQTIVGTVEDVGFYVRPRDEENKHPYHAHPAGDMQKEECVIQENSAEKSMDCIIEAPEHDLYYFGAQLHYNIPKTMCTYFLLSPYYYFKWESGFGPSTVRVDKDKNGKLGRDTDNDGLIDLPVPKCAYDYTLAEGPNCCEGEYQTLVREWTVPTNPDGTPSGEGSYSAYTSSEEIRKWGGNWAACLSGPAMATQRKTKHGFPKADDIFVENKGLNAAYTIEAPIRLEKSSNIYVSNYFAISDHGGNSPKSLEDTEPYYRFTCLDRAFEVKAEIRVLIREWNTEAAFNARMQYPDMHSLTASEPSPFPEYPNNDFWDWLDFEQLNFKFPRQWE